MKKMARDDSKGFDLNKELDSYLSERRKSESDTESNFSFSKYFKGQPTQVVIQEESDVKTYGNQNPGIIRRMMAYFSTSRSLSPEEEQELEEEVAEEFTQEMEDIDKREEEILHEEEELKQKRSSLIWDFIASLNFLRKKEDYDEVVEEGEIMGEAEPELSPDLLQDIKDIGKITVKVMQQIPTNKVKAFKNSPDFVKFKEIMKKYDLIK